MARRKICVVTGSRAEYGLLYWLMKEIAADPALELQVVATGMHLSPEFGLTYRQIEADGFALAARVEMLLSSDTPVGIAKSMGLGVIGFADAFERLRPDIVVVLGDRFEILAAAQAAFAAGISIAHVSGGEVTEGALDDTIRHCITKMARYHFVAADAYRKRVIQLGEHPACVFDVGDPGLDNLVRLNLASREDVAAMTGWKVDRPFFLVTFHPTTTGAADPASGLRELLAALDEFPDHAVLMTKSNADMGGRQLNALVDAYAAARPDRVRAATSLGQLNYLSAMRHCSAVVGNSSSGIVEAPAMGIPTVNIGTRQDGRLKASSVLDCAPRRAEIVATLALALSEEFRREATGTRSLYGNCNASTLILNKLRDVEVDRGHAKRFYDLPA